MVGDRHSLLVREMLDPSPSLIKLHNEMSMPLQNMLAGILTDLLGPQVSEEEILHCAVSIIGQCLFCGPHGLHFRERAFPLIDTGNIEMIADNKHLPPTLMMLAYKCIGPDRLCIVSDATSGAGLPDGSRYHMGEMEYEVADGVGMMLDRSSFAGSTTFLNEMIPVLVDEVNVSLPEAVRMASLTPARIIGVDASKGSLEVGKDADIAIFDEDFSAWLTLIGGQTTF